MARDRDDSRRRLVEILQRAYSGELAAALAYRGHARSVRDAEERRKIAEIELDELRHRERVGEMLAELAGRPVRLREARARLIGHVLGGSCFLAGWYAPMYGAGRLERGNIAEYEAAARHAREAGLPHRVECLLEMAEVEWEHERYFREKASAHFLSRWLHVWPAPGPKASIRDSFARESTADRGRAALAMPQAAR
jgi:rubrerythrin